MNPLDFAFYGTILTSAAGTLCGIYDMIDREIKLARKMKTFAKIFLALSSLATLSQCDSVVAQENPLRIKASDGDVYDISISTSDQALFQNAAGGYSFDAAIYPLAGFRTSNDTLYFYKSGGGVSFKIYLGTSPTNGQTLVSDANKVLTFGAGGGGATAWSAIGDATALGTIDFAGFDQDITSSEDGGDVLTITNTDADRVSSTNILVLADNDLADGEATYLRMIGNVGVSPSTDYIFSQTAFTAFQAVDFSAAAAFRIPVSSAPTVDNTGEVAFDTDIWGASRGAQVAYDGTAATALIGVLVSDAPSNGQVPTWNTGGTITWETPAGSTAIQRSWVRENPTSSENFGAVVFPFATTVDSVRAVVLGSATPSVTINFPHGLNRDGTSATNLFTSGQAVTNTTKGHRFSTFNDATLAAHEWIWMTTSAQSGTVTELAVTIYFTKN